MGMMFPCVGAGALPILCNEVADSGAIIRQLALVVPESLVNTAHFQKS